MSQVVVPGKNWKLSLAELIALLEARKIQFKVGEFAREFFAIHTDSHGVSLDVSSFGGVIKIGRIEEVIQTEMFEKAFGQADKKVKNDIAEQILSGRLFSGMLGKVSSKYLFGVSVYCAKDSLRPAASSIQRFVGSSIKKGLALQDKKAEFMGFPKERRQPQLTHVEVLKKNLVDNRAEVLVCIGRIQTLLAITSSVHNPFEFQKRDVGKPSQRKIFAIPPRLARIMVNLAECNAGKVLLDPFCGVGTILQEALLAKAQVVGVDANNWCVEAATENLQWLRKEYQIDGAEFRVLKGDALRLQSRIGSEVDCIVTEPDLGPALREIPTASYAQKIVEKLSPLYFGFLEEAHCILKKNGRLVIVTPFLRTRSGKPVTLHVEEKAGEIGFKMAYPFGRADAFESYDFVKEDMRKIRRFVDIAEHHKTGREIHVFQK